MALILNIDTSTKICSVSIALKGETVALVEQSSDQFIHSEKLHLFIEDCLNKNGIKASDLDAVAISKGPGSYTGLRIGVSSAKGMAYALDVPLIGINTLEAMTANVIQHNNKKGIYIPMLDARRMEVYCCVMNEKFELLKPTAATIIEEGSFSEYKDQPLFYFGDGAEKCKNVLPPNFEFIDGVLTSAKNLSAVAYQKFKAKEFEDVAYFEPFYLKDFIAGKPKKLL